MTTVRHVAHAAGSTGTSVAAYRVAIGTGAHQLVADEPTAMGGGDAGPAPFDLLVSGLVACTAITLRMYAARKGWELASLEVDARYDVVDETREGSIVRTITFPHDLPADQRDRLADLAERTPVTVAVRAGTPITTTVRS
ncbi:MAG: putative redox protein [Acidimicrobiaceae bacterium]|jgi:putative redox protein|nr:putative redox protein [Acidimicrobiaceae bacterium]